jgi:hypothetical protein
MPAIGQGADRSQVNPAVNANLILIFREAATKPPFAVALIRCPIPLANAAP